MNRPLYSDYPYTLIGTEVKLTFDSLVLSADWELNTVSCDNNEELSTVLQEVKARGPPDKDYPRILFNFFEVFSR